MALKRSFASPDTVSAAGVIRTQDGEAPTPGSASSAALVTCALILSLFLALAAARGASEYYRRHPYFYDPSTYQLHSMQLSARLQTESAAVVAADEWWTNSRCPLRTAPLILLAPGLLTSPVGYVASAWPSVFCFLALSGIFAARRTGATAAGMAAIAAICAVPGLYALPYGLGFYWLELPAALFIGCAAISLLLFIDSSSRAWAASAVVFASCAVLSRYLSVVFALVALAPLLPWCIRPFRARAKPGRTDVALCIAATLFAAAALIFLAHQFRANYAYYTEQGYAIGAPAGAAAKFMAYSIRRFMGRFGLDVICAVILASMSLHLLRGDRRAVYRSIPSLIPFLSTAGILVFGVRTVEAYHSTFYAMPLLLTGTFGLAPGLFGRRLRRAATAGFAAAGVISLAVAGVNARRSMHEAHVVSPADAAQKRFDAELGRGLAALPQPVVYAMFIGQSLNPTLESVSRGGPFLFPVSNQFMTAYSKIWSANHPGLSDAEIARDVMKLADGRLDAAIAFTSPGQADTAFANSTSRFVAREVSHQLAASRTWKRALTLTHPQLGPLAVYVNLSRPAREYRALLRTTQAPLRFEP